MPKVDAGGRWHATIPGKGNRWLPMPDALLSQLNDLIQHEATRSDAGHGAETFKKDFKDLGLRARNTKRLIAKGDIAGAQAKVQKLVDTFPWQDFSNLLESHWLEDEDIANPDLEPIDGQAWAIEEALQAFLDVDPGDFLDLMGEQPAAPEPVAPEPESVAPKREPVQAEAPKLAEVNFKDLTKLDYRNLDPATSAYYYFQYGKDDFPEHLVKRGVMPGTKAMQPDDPKFGQAAMAFYVGEGNGGDYINQALRGTLKDLQINPWKPEERMPEDQQARMVEIAEAAEKYAADEAIALPEDSMLYRGIELKALEQLELTPGAQIPMSGLFSTSASRTIGEDFAHRRKWVKSGKPGALIEIITPKGSRVTAAHIKEQELILQPGELEILSVDNSGKVPVIRAQYKPKGSAKDDKKGLGLQSDDPKAAAAQDAINRRLDAEEAERRVEWAKNAAVPAPRPQGVLLKEFEKGYQRDNKVHLPQGAKGIVELGMLGLGTKVVRKKAKTVKENDREYVASRIAQVLGIDFRVEKVDSRQVIMDFIEGDSGATWYNKQRELFPYDENEPEGPGRVYNQIQKQRDQIKAAAAALPQAKEIGLLDFLIGNEDRHDGNWIAGADGKAWPIDHGLAQFSDHDTESEKAMFVGVGGFMKASLGVINDSWKGGEDSWDPSKNWTHQELEDIQTKLLDLRYDKGVRSRKRWIDESLKRLDIVIEKMGPKPEPEIYIAAAEADAGPVEALKKAFLEGYKPTGEYVWQGARGKVEIGTVADGRKVVYKKMEKEGDDLDTLHETDREELSALISNALGIEVHVARVSENEIVMDHIDGLTGNGWMKDTVLDFPLNKELGRKQFHDREMRQWSAMTDMPGGREIAMLDFLIENTDRHSGNWMITKDKRVLPIDHGYAGFETITSAIHGGQRSIDSPFVTKYFDEVVEAHAVKSINPGKSWTREELEAYREKLAALEPAFAKHPKWHAAVMAKIEKLIVMVPEQAAPESVRPDLQLKAAYEAGYTPTSDKIFQGNTATVEIGVIADGTQVVRKLVKQEKEAKTEYLAGLVANTLGVGPVTVQTGPNEVVMEYVADAKTGNGWLNTNQGNFKLNPMLNNGGRGAWERAERDKYDRMNKAMIEMPGGKEVGLLDWLIDNPDRHAGNWMVKDDTIIPIDHGNARWHPHRYEDGKTGKPVELFNGSPFAEYWLGAKLNRFGELRSLNPQKHWTNQELADIRSKLQDLRDDFTEHPDWHDAIMAKIDRVLEKVKK